MPDARLSLPKSEFEPTRRHIWLGASNLYLGFRLAVEAVRQLENQPVEVIATPSHGRSFGQPSRVLGRVLPGILGCGLWESLTQRPAVPTRAVITDVGNDLIFGCDAETVAHWVEQCVERLADCCEGLALTSLPMASLERLGPKRFHLMRRVLFPRSTLQYEEAMRQARDLNGHVQQIANRFNARLVRPAQQWFGFDPIHIRRRFRRDAWHEFLGIERTQQSRTTEWSLRYKLLRGRPHERFLFGRRQDRKQPSIACADGTTISLY